VEFVVLNHEETQLCGGQYIYLFTFNTDSTYHWDASSRLVATEEPGLEEHEHFEWRLARHVLVCENHLEDMWMPLERREDRFCERVGVFLGDLFKALLDACFVLILDRKIHAHAVRLEGYVEDEDTQLGKELLQRDALALKLRICEAELAKVGTGD